MSLFHSFLWLSNIPSCVCVCPRVCVRVCLRMRVCVCACARAYTTFSSIHLLRCAQLCLTLHALMDWSLPGFPVRWIFQAKILEGVAIPTQGIFLTQKLKVHPLCLSYIRSRLFPTVPSIDRHVGCFHVLLIDSPGGKESTCNAGDTGDARLIPGSGRYPGKGSATHCSILAWKISWTEEPGSLQSMWSQRDDWTTEHRLFPYLGYCK